MLLYIIRHGLPDYTTDTLTDIGNIQAELVGKRLAKEKIDEIFSSPMGRAMQTADPACKLLGLKKTIEPWSHEVEDERLTPFPDGKLKSISMLQNTYYLENGYIDLPYEKSLQCQGINESNIGVPLDVIEKGGRIFLEKLGYKYENGVYKIINANDNKIALFCHGTFERVWLSTLLHIPLHIMFATFDLPAFTGVTVLEFKNNQNGFTAPKLLAYSDTSHLPQNLVARWPSTLEGIF